MHHFYLILTVVLYIHPSHAENGISAGNQNGTAVHETRVPSGNDTSASRPCTESSNSSKQGLIHGDTDRNVDQVDILNSDYYRLESKLLKNYQPYIRPVRSHHTPTNVTLALKIIAVHEVNEMYQTLRHYSWLHLEWTDEFLKWDPEQYKGLRTIELPSNKIWLPRLVFANSVMGSGDVTSDQAYFAPVSSDGLVVWGPVGMRETLCSMDITFYPFDSQVCKVTIEMWSSTEAQGGMSAQWQSIRATQHQSGPSQEVDFRWMPQSLSIITTRRQGSEIECTIEFYLKDLGATIKVNLTSASAELEWNFVDNAEWRVTSLDVELVSTIFKGDPYPRVVVSIHLKRRRLFHFLTLIVPNVLLAILAAFVFALPEQCGEKLSYSMALLLAFAVNLSMLVNSMPKSSLNISLLMVYLTSLSVVTALSVITTTMILRFYHSDNNLHPKTEALVRLLGKLFRFKGPRDGTTNAATSAKYESSCQSDDHDFVNFNQKNDRETVFVDALSRGKYKVSALQEPVSKETNMLNEAPPEDVNTTMAWNVAAVILDHVFFRIFIFTIVGMTSVFVLALFIGK